MCSGAGIKGWMNKTDFQSYLPLGSLTLIFSVFFIVAHRPFLKTLSRESYREINSWSINSKTFHAGRPSSQFMPQTIF